MLTCAVELRRYRNLGFAGAVGVAVGGIGLGALPAHDPLDGWPGIAELRAVPLLAVASAYFGMTLLVAAWLRIGRLAPTADMKDLRGILLWWAAPFVVVPPMYSRDVYAYIAQGAMVVRGIDPYTFGPSVLGNALVDDVPVMWRDTPAPYGPVFLLLAAAVVKLTGANTILAGFGMRLVALAGVALISRYVPRLAESAGASPTSGYWLAVLNPLLLAHLIGGAHNDALMIGLMVCGLAVAVRGNPPAGAAIVALAVLVKAPALVALAVLVPVAARRLSGRSRLLRAAAGTTAVAAAVVAAVTFLSRLGFGWVAALDTPTVVKNGMSMTTNAGQVLGRMAAALGVADPEDVLALCRAAGALAAVLIAAWALLRALAPGRSQLAGCCGAGRSQLAGCRGAGRSQLAGCRGAGRIRRANPVWALGVALTALTALSPVVQPWYLLWGFVPLAAAAAHRPRVRWFVIVASVALLYYLLPFGGGPINPLTAGSVVGLAIGLFYLRLQPPGEVLKRHAVPVDAEPADHPGGDGGDDRMAPELLPRVDVRDVHLDQRRVE
jgi:hypothetical protein